MSKHTFSVTFSIGFKVVIGSEEIKEIRSGLQRALDVLNAKEANGALTADEKAGMEFANSILSLKSDDEVAAMMIKTGLRRGFRDVLMAELKDVGCCKFSPAKVEVTPRG